MWDKVFKNGSIEVCGRQPLKSLKYYELILRYIAFSQQRILSEYSERQHERTDEVSHEGF